ncbi:MAG: hypothetical protein IJ751_10800 [Oscillospiraceae bacterium]|nr:hypothetical protein [Oscillospiraceae bacterium]
MKRRLILIALVLALLLPGCGAEPAQTPQGVEDGHVSAGELVEQDGQKRFQFPNGQDAADCMIWLDGERYYFDSDGFLNPTAMWREVDGSWYRIGEEGYALRNRWFGTYYLLDSGEMATDQYIDRFHVNEDGFWPENSWSEADWLVGGTWHREGDSWVYENGDCVQEIDLSGVKSINRLGYDTYGEDGTLPEQSLPAYQRALEQGFTVLLCDLQFTRDGVGVCFHDRSIHRVARNRDGSELPSPDAGGERIYLAEHTYDALSAYDYGIYRGSEFAGLGLLRLEDMLEFCASQGVEELYIEIKDGDAAQIAAAVALTKQYHLPISWSGSTVEQCRAVVDADPTARVATMPCAIDQAAIDELLSLRTPENEVFFFAYGNAILTEDTVETLRRSGIAFEMGTIDSDAEVIRYWNEAYQYCSGIESDVIVASGIDLDDCLPAMTQGK